MCRICTHLAEVIQRRNDSLPDGWTGKLWALNQGLQIVKTPLVLFLDADIELERGMIATLRKKMLSEELDLVSIMASLRMESFWEKLLIPAFIYFFKLIYPFALGDHEADDLPFHVNSYSQSSSALRLTEDHRTAFPNEKETAATTVEASTLDRIFELIDLAPPVLLKLDVQGYEAKVLLGGVKTLKRVDYVVLEASLRPMYN